MALTSELQKGIETLTTMNELMDLIVQNGKQLLRMTKKDLDEDKLEELQCSQDSLVERLKNLDQHYQESFKTDSIPETHQKLVNGIKKKLSKFEKLNTNLIENIEVRRGLIKIELNEIEKRKRVLDEIGKAYSFEDKPTRKKVDTLK